MLNIEEIQAYIISITTFKNAYKIIKRVQKLQSLNRTKPSIFATCRTVHGLNQLPMWDTEHVRRHRGLMPRWRDALDAFQQE